MMATISAVFSATSPLYSGLQAKQKGFLGIMDAKSLTYDHLQVKATSLADEGKVDKGNLSSSPKIMENQFSDKSWFSGVDTNVSVGIEDWKPRALSGFLTDSISLGRNTQDGYVFCQSFTIRSYEIRADGKMSLETLMNLLQEVALNHFKVVGLPSEGFGSTTEMVKRNLIWVASRFQVIVDRYPTWGDVIQVESWITLPGKNKMCGKSLVLDIKTGETLARGSFVWVVINKHTRKLSKIPDVVRAEFRPYVAERLPIVVSGHGRKLSKLDESTADEIRGDLTPKWTDLDVNEHVNYAKYIDWVLESTPEAMMESHELSSINIEYRRECGRDSILQSLTAISGATDGIPMDSSAGHVECQHLLRLRDGPEVLRARTEWRLKHAMNSRGARS